MTLHVNRGQKTICGSLFSFDHVSSRAQFLEINPQIWGFVVSTLMCYPSYRFQRKQEKISNSPSLAVGFKQDFMKPR